jgi:hypothetical protein
MWTTAVRLISHRTRVSKQPADGLQRMPKLCYGSTLAAIQPGLRPPFNRSPSCAMQVETAMGIVRDRVVVSELRR